MNVFSVAQYTKPKFKDIQDRQKITWITGISVSVILNIILAILSGVWNNERLKLKTDNKDLQNSFIQCQNNLSQCEYNCNLKICNNTIYKAGDKIIQIKYSQQVSPVNSSSVTDTLEIKDNGDIYINDKPAGSNDCGYYSIGGNTFYIDGLQTTPLQNTSNKLYLDQTQLKIELETDTIQKQQIYPLNEIYTNFNNEVIQIKPSNGILYDSNYSKVLQIDDQIIYFDNKQIYPVQNINTLYLTTDDQNEYKISLPDNIYQTPKQTTQQGVLEITNYELNNQLVLNYEINQQSEQIFPLMNSINILTNGYYSVFDQNKLANLVLYQNGEIIKRNNQQIYPINETVLGDTIYVKDNKYTTQGPGDYSLSVADDKITKDDIQIYPLGDTIYFEANNTWYSVKGPQQVLPYNPVSSGNLNGALEIGGNSNPALTIKGVWGEENSGTSTIYVNNVATTEKIEQTSLLGTGCKVNYLGTCLSPANGTKIMNFYNISQEQDETGQTKEVKKLYMITLTETDTIKPTNDTTTPEAENYGGTINIEEGVKVTLSGTFGNKDFNASSGVINLDQVNLISQKNAIYYKPTIIDAECYIYDDVQGLCINPLPQTLYSQNNDGENIYQITLPNNVVYKPSNNTVQGSLTLNENYQLSLSGQYGTETETPTITIQDNTQLKTSNCQIMNGTKCIIYSGVDSNERYYKYSYTDTQGDTQNEYIKFTFDQDSQEAPDDVQLNININNGQIQVSSINGFTYNEDQTLLQISGQFNTKDSLMDINIDQSNTDAPQSVIVNKLNTNATYCGLSSVSNSTSKKDCLYITPNNLTYKFNNSGIERYYTLQGPSENIYIGELPQKNDTVELSTINLDTTQQTTLTGSFGSVLINGIIQGDDTVINLSGATIQQTSTTSTYPVIILPLNDSITTLSTNSLCLVSQTLNPTSITQCWVLQSNELKFKYEFNETNKTITRYYQMIGPSSNLIVDDIPTQDNDTNGTEYSKIQLQDLTGISLNGHYGNGSSESIILENVIANSGENYTSIHLSNITTNGKNGINIDSESKIIGSDVGMTIDTGYIYAPGAAIIITSSDIGVKYSDNNTELISSIGIGLHYNNICGSYTGIQFYGSSIGYNYSYQDSDNKISNNSILFEKDNKIIGNNSNILFGTNNVLSSNYINMDLTNTYYNSTTKGKTHILLPDYKYFVNNTNTICIASQTTDPTNVSQCFIQDQEQQNYIAYKFNFNDSDGNNITRYYKFYGPEEKLTDDEIPEIDSSNDTDIVQVSKFYIENINDTQNIIMSGYYGLNNTDTSLLIDARIDANQTVIKLSENTYLQSVYSGIEIYGKIFIDNSAVITTNRTWDEVYNSPTRPSAIKVLSGSNITVISYPDDVVFGDVTQIYWVQDGVYMKSIPKTGDLYPYLSFIARFESNSTYIGYPNETTKYTDLFLANNGTKCMVYNGIQG